MRRAAAVIVAMLVGGGHAFAQGSVDAEKVYLWTGGTSRMNISTGSGAPSGGATGDFYVDYLSGEVYAKRSSGSWTLMVRAEDTNTFTVDQTFNTNISVLGALKLGPSATAILQSPTADLIEQYRTTNAQRFNIYNTRTSSSNNEYGYLWWNSNIFRLGTDAGSGGGADRNIEFEPGATLAMRLVASDQTVNVASHLNPITNLVSRLGDSTHKYSLLYSGELVVGTLVAQQTVATIGGRVIVAPTNLLTAALAAAGTTITVKYNNLANGDRIYMESGGSVEWMAVTSAAGGSAGVYTYTVTRNLDGTGADTWSAGDAIVDTGTTGNGYLDIFSTSGVLSGTGPSIVGNVRTGTTYNQVAARWAIGNLDTLYGYSGTTYGAAFGDASNTNVTIDATNGFRIRSGTTDKLKADTSGNLSLTGDLVMSTSGAFRSSGATAFGTGTGWWLDYNAGCPRLRVGDPSGQRVQWDCSNLTLVSDTMTVDTNGVTVVPNTTASLASRNGYRFTSSTGDLGLYAYEVGGGTPSKSLFLQANGITGTTANQIFISTLAATGITLTSSTTAASSAITVKANTIGLEGTVGTQGTVNASADFVITDGSAGSNSIVIQAGTGATAFFGTSSGDDLALLAGNSTQATVCTSGSGSGIKIGSPTGGCKGVGTLNVSGGLYLNGTLYTNPEPLLQEMQAVIAGLESRVQTLEQSQKGGSR